MKTVDIRPKNIIKTSDSDFCSFEEINGDYYRYSFSYEIDPSVAIANKASKIVISFSKEAPNSVQSNNIVSSVGNEVGPSGIDNTKVISSILRRSSTEKDTAKLETQQSFFSFISDFTSKISNTLTTKLTQAKGSPVVVNKRLKFQTVNKESTGQNLVVFESTKQPDNTIKTFSSKDFRRLSEELISVSSVDPSELFVSQNLISTGYSVYSGIETKKNESLVEKFHAQHVKEALNSVTTVDASAKLQATTITQPTTTNETAILVEELADIPQAMVSDSDFFVTFSVLDFNENVLQKITRSVPHSRLISSFNFPLLPPNIQVKKNGVAGNNKIQLVQRDAKAIGVKLYRKVLNQCSNKATSSFVFVDDIKINLSDGVKYYTDSLAQSGKVIYRAIPYGRNETLGAEFSSTIFNSATSKTNYISYSKVGKAKSDSFVSIKSTIASEAIKVEVKNIPGDTISLSLLKADITKKPINPIFSRISPSPVLVSSSDDSYITFFDEGVKKGNLYLYVVELIKRNGSVVTSSTSSLIEYNPPVTNLVETRILNIKSVVVGSETDINFEIDTSFIEKDESEIKSILESQGLGQLFTTSLNKSKPKELFAYRIFRLNQTTGAFADLGNFSDTIFSDIKASSVSGAEKIVQGQEYTYFVYTLLRAPETLLENYEVSIEDPFYASKNYSYKPSKWKHPLTLKQGNIVSPESLSRNHAKSRFGFGDVASITEATISLAEQLPTLFNCRASRITKDTNRITWSVKGDASKIDFFIVILELLGMRTIIGKSHSITSDGNLQFYHFNFDDQKGAMKYIVVPVYYDYSRGREIVSNEVIV